MHPIILSIGPIHLFSLGLFLTLSWFVFSFVFWKLLRNGGMDEERIFDLTFYSTLVAIVVSRLSFVVTHFELFRSSLLRVVALWVQPGLSLYGAWIGGILTLVYLSRRYKVRLGVVLDALAFALPASLLIGLVGAFLDGSVVGKMSQMGWAIRYVGIIGKRHPVQIYEFIAVAIMLLILMKIDSRAKKNKWPYGLVGICFFLIYAPTAFLIEFFKDSSVYLKMLSANQWVLVAFFAEAVGAFYVRGGGRERARPLASRFRFWVGGFYAKFSKRHSGEHQASS